ncbi:MAG: ATP phosphoribosyltransferase [Thermoproteota archaeon]
MKRKIRIAIPSKGRLKPSAIQVLRKAGITILKEERSYLSDTSDPKIEAVFARAFDVPVYVHYGAVDLGITGHDLILEREANVHELLDLGFGECTLVVAAPKNSEIQTIDDVPTVARVATEYPNLARGYFRSLGKQVEILELDGTSELAPKLDLAEIIVDITSTGETLRKNDLQVIATILDSTCRLACNKISYRTFEDEIDDFVSRVNQPGETE